LPDAAHVPPGATEQLSVVFAILPGVPVRNVTVTVLVRCERTFSVVAVHPAGTHVSTESVSLAAPFELFTD
jgi:hypothetical protein